MSRKLFERFRRERFLSAAFFLKESGEDTLLAGSKGLPAGRQVEKIHSTKWLFLKIIKKARLFPNAPMWLCFHLAHNLRHVTPARTRAWCYRRATAIFGWPGLLLAVGVGVAVLAVDPHAFRLLAPEAALAVALLPDLELEVVELAELGLRRLALRLGRGLPPLLALRLGRVLPLLHHLHGGREPVGLAAGLARQVAALAAHGVLLHVRLAGPALEALLLADGGLDDPERHQPDVVLVGGELLLADDAGHGQDGLLLGRRRLGLGTLDILLLGRHGTLQKSRITPRVRGK